MVTDRNPFSCLTPPARLSWVNAILPSALAHHFSIEPCLPSLAKTPPTGPDWIHEIKHDGFRVLARRDGKGVRLISRKGKDLTYRFPLAAQAVAALPVHSCLIDGEAIVCDEKGWRFSSLIRGYRNDHARRSVPSTLSRSTGRICDGSRSRTAKQRLRLSCAHRIRHSVNDHYDVEGTIVYHHACALGCEGIVSKRLGSPYRFGRSADWIKVKNPAAPAVKREAEEDWAR